MLSCRPLLECVVIVASAVVNAAGLAASEVEANPRGLPQGPGLAQKVGDWARLRGHPDVVLVEDFELDTISQLQSRWTQISHPEIMSLASENAPGSTGTRSLLMTHTGGRGTGGHLYRRLERGYKQLFVRFYVKFDPDCAPIHHFFHVGGYYPPTPWPQGGAGERPRGNERLTVGIEPFGSDWRWDYYTYWMEMRASPPRGQTWGNCFINDPNLKVTKGRWQCLEVMIQLNDPPSERNGELALWLDGRLVSHLGAGFPRGKWTFDRFLPGQGGQSIRWNDEKGGPETFTVPPGGEPFPGFRWRNDERLQINFVWALLYITKAPEGHISRVWFDDIVAATRYIGPNPE
ncbi:hypothetical protein [Thermogutta sp.]|uniref:hypothetical protein n=1 Tax=Thermogutta sp. TaxID=1962930 RepID=UPI003C799728